ncbi:unnamed protein product [Citrullus colocynthis]|uniref:Acetylajmalan esterase-like n=1 Tax=Citrullus colocynthis TaxID=252529 RepID=A0ABP0Y5L0_9ROSI
MFSHFNSICYGETDCNEKLKNALFLVGEIGGNDYNYALLQGKTIQKVKDMVPEVVQTIKNVVERVISYGANSSCYSWKFLNWMFTHLSHWIPN